MQSRVKSKKSADGYKHKNKKSKFVLGVAVILGVSILGLSYALVQARTPANKEPLEHISTGLIGEYASLIVIAQQQGYFQKNGLSVDITQYDSGPVAIAAMQSGEVDTAMGADFAAAMEGFRGGDLRFLATISKSEAFLMVVRNDRGIRDASDLKGKKIGITRKTVGEFYLGQFLTFNDLTLGDVQLTDMTQSKLIGALAGGTIDAAVLFEPNAYRAKQRLDDAALSWPVQSGQHIYSSLYGTSRLTQNHPGKIKKYIKALVQAEEFVRANDVQAQRIIAQYFGYDDAYIQYIWPKFIFSVSLDQELLINMDDEAHWAIENKLVVATQPPDYLRMIYFDGLEAVKPEAISVIR